MRAISLITLLWGILSVPTFGANALPTDSATEKARLLFDQGVACHNRYDFDCAIDSYKGSLREVERPQTLVLVAWACHDKLSIIGQSSDAAREAFSCAQNFYLRAIAACEAKNQIWERKSSDCERTQRQYPKLESLRPLPTAAPIGPAMTSLPSPPSPPLSPTYTMPPTASRQDLVTIPHPRYSTPINHAKNLQIAGIVLGSIGLAGTAVGIALSQTMPAEPISPSPFNANYAWTMYDYMTLTAAGVAVLGGALWLSDRLMRPRVRVLQSYPVHRYY